MTADWPPPEDGAAVGTSDESSLVHDADPGQRISALERSNAPSRPVGQGKYTAETMYGADADPSEVAIEYPAIRARVIDIVSSLDESAGAWPVPACPAWTVSDLIAHLVGVPEDILAGRTDGLASDAWTDAQVQRHRGETLAELRGHLLGLAGDFDPLLAHVPVPINGQFLVDALTHEHDLREAVSMPGAREARAVSIVTSWLLLHQRIDDDTIAAFERAGADEYTVMRALTGRMSMRQMRDADLPADAVAAVLSGPALRLPTD